MKLYELPDRCYFRIIEGTQVPPDAPPVSTNEVFYFDHIDGMYSFCKNSKGEVVHVVAWAEVEQCEAPKNVKVA